VGDTEKGRKNYKDERKNGIMSKRIKMEEK
jgi:hypothetical protein